MIIRSIDATNDWTFGKGLGNYSTQESAIEENIQTRLLSWVGDCFFALPDGVDWKNRLDVGQQDLILDEIKTVILQSYGVVAVNSVTGVFNGATRLFSITYNIDTIFSSSFQSQLTQPVEV